MCVHAHAQLAQKRMPLTFQICFFLQGLQHVCKESAEQARNFVWHVYYFAYFQDFFFLKRTILMPRQRQAISEYWMACVLRRWLIRFFSFCIAYDTYAKTGPSHLKILNGMCSRALTYPIFLFFFSLHSLRYVCQDSAQQSRDSHLEPDAHRRQW
jgi:hypothetical protein